MFYFYQFKDNKEKAMKILITWYPDFFLNMLLTRVRKHGPGTKG